MKQLAKVGRDLRTTQRITNHCDGKTVKVRQIDKHRAKPRRVVIHSRGCAPNPRAGSRQRIDEPD